MGLKAYITEVKQEFHDEFANVGVLDELRDFLEEYCSVFVVVGEAGESDFQEWEIDRDELKALIARVESDEIQCPDLGKKNEPGFISGSSLLVWLKKLVVSSPDSSCVTIDWL